jgi:subtilisin family serine protease
VLLKDKADNGCTISEPERFLSSYAVEKRRRFHIPVTETDMPLSPAYLDTLSRLDSGCRVLTTSKWFNYVVLGTNDSGGVSDSLRERIALFPWVAGVYDLHQIPDSMLQCWFDTFSAVRAVSASPASPAVPAADTSDADSIWGASTPQLACLNGLLLHRLGYTGQGMRMAVIDGGFLNVDSLDMFGSLRSSGRLKGFRNVTDDTTAFFRGQESHGQKVLSIMGVNRPGEFVGSAPDADYWLFRSEHTGYEDMLEEFFLAAAVEKADSLGVDVMNISLGYTIFDDKAQDHTWNDLDGRHSVASIAVEAAVHRGCVVNVAAGNEGDKPWLLFCIPSDAPAVLCVTAVGMDSTVAFFSSKGDSLRLKPDIASIGWGVAFCDWDDKVAYGNGTSFATPLNAGLTACLWQAFPHKTAEEVIDAVRRSADRYLGWNRLTGYGIPDYAKAYHLLKGDLDVAGVAESRLRFHCYPNPVKGTLWLSLPEGSPARTVRLYDIQGRMLLRMPVSGTLMEIGFSTLPAGSYFLMLSGGGEEAVRMVVKE